MLARGTSATLVWLGIVTLGVVAISALLLAFSGVGLSGSQDASYFEEFWQSLLRVMDAGTMAGDVGWGRRVLALAITVFGLLVVGTLIGVIAAGVEGRIESMQRGRSVVVESGHIVILGSSDRLPILVRQLTLSLAMHEGSAIVILADDDAAELKESVHSAGLDHAASRLVFRSGDTTRRSDLALARLQDAETIIVLTDDGPGDTRALLTVIAVQAELGDSSVPVVVDLDEVSNAAHIAQVFGGDVHTLVASQAIARIASLALRQPGLGAVARALFDDKESDVHVCDVPGVEGSKFGDIQEKTKDGRVIGVLRSDGTPLLNLPPSALIESGDRLVAISDSSTLTMHDTPAEPLSTGPELDLAPIDQHLLVLGWSEVGANMLVDWAQVATSSSTVEVMIDRTVGIEADAIELGDAAQASLRVTPDADLKDMADRVPSVDTVILLASSVATDDAADARTLLMAAAIRRMADSSGGPAPRLVIELANPEHIPLAGARLNDFIVSAAIGSQLITQLTEQPERRAVLLDLYDPATASLHLVPTGALGLTGSFSAAEVYAAGRASGVTAIGWRFAPDRGGELVINADSDTLVDLHERDEIVIVG